MDESFKKKLQAENAAMEYIKASQQAHELLSKSITRVPDFSFPSISSPDFRVPDIHIPSPEERNAYQSASALMKSIAEEALLWKQRLPEMYSTAILAILYGGAQVNVQNLSQVSFHGIRIEGTLAGAPCSLFAHQSTVQLLCCAEKLDDREKRNPIGFVWGNNKVEV